MDYYFNKTSLGTGSLLELLKEIDQKIKDILIISSPTVVRSQKVEYFIDNLRVKSDVKVFGEMQPDAPLPLLEQIIKNFRKPELIIAIGGGSVIDAAKALSVGWEGSSLGEMFYKRANLPKRKIPVFAVPTTAGTGAELSFGAIIFDTENNIKSGLRGEILRPDLAIIDVDLFLMAPSKLIAETGFDCLTHAIETYISKAASPIVKEQSLLAIQTVFANLGGAFNKNNRSMEKIAIASSLMGVNLALSSTCLPHRIQYALRKFHPHSHAQGLIALYRGWLTEVIRTEAFANLSEDLLMNPKQLVKKINDLKSDLGIDYRLSDFNFKSQEILPISLEVSGNLEMDPSFQSQDTLINILKNSI